jgi:hypothetical protein
VTDVDKYPIPQHRRRLYEASIRAVDLIVYGLVLAGGFYAALATPSTVVDEFVGWEWLIGVWAAFLLAGGLVGFVGRLTRRWLVETPATVAAFTGILVYLIVLGRFAFSSVTAAVAAALVAVAALVMLRRWLELQIFGTQPGLDLRGRMLAAAMRRTGDTAHRHR